MGDEIILVASIKIEGSGVESVLFEIDDRFDLCWAELPVRGIQWAGFIEVWLSSLGMKDRASELSLRTGDGIAVNIGCPGLKRADLGDPHLESRLVGVGFKAGVFLRQDAKGCGDDNPKRNIIRLRHSLLILVAEHDLMGGAWRRNLFKCEGHGHGLFR